MSGSKKRNKRKPGKEDQAGEPGQAHDAGQRGRELAEKAIENADSGLAKEIEKLSPEEAAVFLQLVEKAFKKRRIQLIGYVLALFLMVGGMLSAFLIYAQREPDQFLGWVFLVPFTLVGAVLLAFGHWSRKL
ncbi:MAG: hypothetical protein MJE77_23740 [Proteobacteria bacterium]|nr:hypothetical protein [Pseudomonadota bacterium]